MASIETACRFQTAVLWEAAGVDAYGEAKVSDPIEIKVRWEQRERESISSGGDPIRFDATIVTDRRIKNGSILWLGELSSIPGGGTSTGEAIQELHQQVDFVEAPDIFNRNIRRELMLRRFKGVLPTVTT